MAIDAIDGFTRAVHASIQRFVRVGIVGKLEPNGTTTIVVPTRPHFVYVRTGPAATGGEIIEAYNAGSPRKENVPVLLIRWNRIWRIISLDSESPALTKDMYPVAYHQHGRKYGLPQSILDLDGFPSSFGAQDQVLAVNPDGSGTYWKNDDAGSGAEAFTDLSDVPVSYSGHGSKIVAVKVAEDGLEFIAVPTAPSDTDDLAEGMTNLYHTDERAQDAVGTILTDGNGIDLSYDDVTPAISADLTTLTSDWDIGEDRAILLERLQARDAEGILFYDDDGNIVGRISDEGDFGFGGVPISAIRAFFEDGAARIRISSTTNDESAGIAFGALGASGAAGNAYMFFKGHQTEALRHLAFAADASNVNMYLYGNGPVHIPSNPNHPEELIVGDDVGVTVGNTATIISLMDADAVPVLMVGKSATRNFLFAWQGAGDGTGYGQLEAWGGSNDVALQSNGGRVVIGLAPSAAGANLLGIEAGSSGNDAAVGGVLYSAYPDTMITIPSTSSTLYTIPANTLAVNGQSIWFELSLTTSSPGTINLIPRLGGVSLGTLAISTSSNTAVVKMRVIRTGATTSRSIAMMSLASQGLSDQLTFFGVPNLTWANSLAFTLQVSAPSGAVVVRSIVVGWDDANT